MYVMKLKQILYPDIVSTIYALWSGFQQKKKQGLIYSTQFSEQTLSTSFHLQT